MYANDPTRALPKTTIFCSSVNLLLVFVDIFFDNAVIVQNKNKIAKALHIADIMLIINATLFVSRAKRLKNLPRSWKKGAPGGCPTSSL